MKQFFASLLALILITPLFISCDKDEPAPIPIPSPLRGSYKLISRTETTPNNPSVAEEVEDELWIFNHNNT